jgi:hypothetical protein
VPQPFKRKPDENEFPNPEQNPLVNPLLAANMGRWAEVYFTTPPERRAQAIQDLLRELENNSPARSSSTPVIDIEKRKKTEQKPTITEVSDAVICAACRHGNRAGQRFCGMCGVALPASSEGSAARVVGSWPPGRTTKIDQAQTQTQTKIDLTKIDQTPANQAKVPPAMASPPTNSPTAIPPAITPATINRRSLNRSEPGSVDVGGGSTPERDDGFLLRQRLSDNDLPSFAVEPDSFPYRYRLSIGVALAILLGILVYMAWHGTPSFFGGGRHSALPQAVPADQSAPANRAAENLAPPNPTRPPAAAPAAKSVPVASTPASSSVPATNRPGKLSPASNVAVGRQHLAPPAARKSPEPAPSSNFAAAQSGAEELAIAEKYLNGSAGTARDSQAAAPWLWKAVAKGNLTATLALSDLYLHGDGVPKSCDQGRLLLDVAAKKGVAAAAYRLRNLQAFGCD